MEDDFLDETFGYEKENVSSTGRHKSTGFDDQLPL
jgi:hypothetical protein